MTVDYAAEARRRPKGRDFGPLARLLPFVTRYKLQVTGALLALIVAAVATLAVPIAIRRIIDNGFDAARITMIDQYFLALLGIGLVLALGSGVRYYCIGWLGERVVADIRDAVFSHLLKLSPGFFENQKTGEVMSRLTADTTQIKAVFSSSASVALRNFLMFLGAIVMMVATSPKLSGLALLAIPLLMIPLIIFGRKVRRLSRMAQDTLAESAAFAQERLTAIATVQSNVQERTALDAFEESTRTSFKAAAFRTFARAIFTGSIIAIVALAIVGLLWFGAGEVIRGSLSAGTLGQFVLYAFIAASSLGQLSEMWGEVQLAAGAAERIVELLDEVPQIAPPAQPKPMPEPALGTVSFEHVSFSYPSRPKEKALDDVSFSVAAGETVAIVGPSGSGKTTAFALLQRFFDPQSGDVRVDGVDVREVMPQELRSRVAIVPQETMIFSGTVYDNIRFGKPNAKAEEVMAAAKAARVDEFARKLPKGYQTEVGERGVTLSGGQRQRVAIARAILRNAPILLLDEATSALDAESEAFIQEALEEATHDRTTLVIAHRLATVRNADRILVFEHGRLIAQGRHADLVKKSPLYARLAKLQFNVPSA